MTQRALSVAGPDPHPRSDQSGIDRRRFLSYLGGPDARRRGPPTGSAPRPRLLRAAREEAGQCITTPVAVLIAEVLDLPPVCVTVTLADARPELLIGVLTGGSNAIRSVDEPVRPQGQIGAGRGAPGRGDTAGSVSTRAARSPHC